MPKIRKEPVDVRIGERLRTLRLERGLSQADLGKALDISYQQIQKYEKGGNRMSASTLLKVARFFALPPQCMFEGLLETNDTAMAGFREEAAPASHASYASNAETSALLSAFQRIADPDARKRLLELAKNIAGEA